MSEETKTDPEPKKSFKSSKITVYVTVLIVLSFAVGFLAGGLEGTTTGQVISGNEVSADFAGQKAVAYINDYLVQSGEATLVSTEKMSSVYKVTTNYQGNDIDVYVTLDGKYLALSTMIDLDETPETQTEPEDTGTEIPKAEKTNVKFFVMSYCPYGNQAEEGLDPVYESLKDKVDWEPHYVIYSNYGGGGPDYCLDAESQYCSMHGIQELNEDVRELCMWKYVDHDTWWSYVMDVNNACNSQNVDSCWEAVAEKYGIDTEMIKTCEQDEAMDLLAAEVSLNEQYGVRGSPTVLINGVAYQGSRDPASYQAAICSGFENPPEECSEVLSGSASAAAGECG